MLNRGHGNCGSPQQYKRETENARRKGVGSRRATSRLKSNELIEQSESRDNKTQDDDRDTGSYPGKKSALGGKEDARIRGGHRDHSALGAGVQQGWLSPTKRTVRIRTLTLASQFLRTAALRSPAGGAR